MIKKYSHVKNDKLDGMTKKVYTCIVPTLGREYKTWQNKVFGEHKTVLPDFDKKIMQMID